MASLTIAPLHPSLGAEVAGVDLSNGLDGHADTRGEDRAKYGRPVDHR